MNKVLLFYLYSPRTPNNLSLTFSWLGTVPLNYATHVAVRGPAACTPVEIGIFYSRMHILESIAFSLIQIRRNRMGQTGNCQTNIRVSKVHLVSDIMAQ